MQSRPGTGHHVRIVEIGGEGGDAVEVVDRDWAGTTDPLSRRRFWAAW